MFSLAIAFPLGFSIQSAFKRREKALEYLSLFKSGLLALHYSFRTVKKLSSEKKNEIRNILVNASDKLLHQIQSSNGDMNHFQSELDKIYDFIEQNREAINARVLSRVVRYTEDVADGSAYLLSLVIHRTMTGLRTYAIIFITLFSAFHGPLLFYKFESLFPYWAIYLNCALSSLLLATLYNFQQLIEYPFDQKGSDDIKLAGFKLNI